MSLQEHGVVQCPDKWQTDRQEKLADQCNGLCVLRSALSRCQWPT